MVMPHGGDMKLVLAYALVFAVLRWVLEGTVFRWLGRAWLTGRPAAMRAVCPHPAVLKAYDANPKLKSDPAAPAMVALAAQTGLKEARIIGWIKDMKEAEELVRHPNKWTETCWRATFYLSLTAWGIYCCHDKVWLFDMRAQWESWPRMPVDPEVRLWYLLELAVYYNMLLTQFFDVRRKDFAAMFIHHLLTIGLLTTSYFNGWVRNGGLVLLCHDPCDCFLEIAKLSKYCGRQIWADINFAFFAVGWFVLRLVIFPFWVIYSFVVVAPSVLPPFRSYYVFAGMVIALDVLHVYWFYFIIKIVYNKLVYDLEIDDVREDEDDAAAAGGSSRATKKKGQ